MATNAIHLKGDYQIYASKAAGGAITPGMLLSENSAGALIAHATEGGYVERIVAQEDALQGKTVADAYTTGDIVSALVELPGNEVQLLLEAGQNVVIGTQLISSDNGKVIALAAAGSGVTVKQIVGVACEALNLTASGAVDTLLAVRML